MVNDWKPRFWLLLSPLHAGLAVLLWIAPCHAALLMDIRIGEYDHFTRIAFEFNVQTSIDSIGKLRPGELKITFPDVRAQFKRSIPQKQSERLKAFEVWQNKTQLVVIFKFNYDKLRFDSFQLKNPHRLVVDVYPEPSQAKTSETRQKESIQEPIPQTDLITPLATKSKSDQKPPPLDRLSLSLNGKPSEAAGYNSTAEQNPSTAKNLPDPKTAPVKKAPAVQSSGLRHVRSGNSGFPDIQAERPSIEAVDNETAPVAKMGLQYYLLIALVILTIVILSLLVAMLFSRHKWTNGKKTLKINDLLHRQDEHIASINSQIEEHLKRYDEI